MFAVRARQRARLLDALRRFPTTASAYPFGEDVHVSDTRVGLDADAFVAELQAFLLQQGLDDVRIRAKAPGIEDAFIALMGAAPEAAA